MSRLLEPDARHEGVRRINVYALRALYFLMFFALGKTVWSEILTHQGSWESQDSVAWCVWAGFAAIAGLGLLHPIKMLPVILLEIFYKVLWLVVVAYPLWKRNELAGSWAEETAKVFFPVFVPILIVPWRYVAASYLRPASPKRWRNERNAARP
jgi:hypothetical protein